MSELDPNALKKFYVRIDTDKDGKVTARELIDGINNLFFRKLKEHLRIYITEFPLSGIELFDIEGTNLFKLNQIQAIVESSIEFVATFFRHQLFPDSLTENRTLFTRLFNVFLTSDNPAQNSAFPELFTSFTERLKRGSEATQRLASGPGAAAVPAIPSQGSHVQSSQQSVDRSERRLSAQMSRFGVVSTQPQGFTSTPAVVAPEVMSSSKQQSAKSAQGSIDPVILERHRNDIFTEEERQQILRQSLDHAQALARLYPVDTDEGTFGCSNDYIKPRIIGNDADPGLTDSLLRHIFGDLIALNKNYLAEKVINCIAYRPMGGGIMRKKSKKNKRTKY